MGTPSSVPVAAGAAQRGRLASPALRHAIAALLAFALLAGAGSFAPKWLTFLLTMAAGNGLVSLGIVCLMRGARRNRDGRRRAHQIRRAWVRWNRPSGRNISTMAMTT